MSTENNMNTENRELQQKSDKKENKGKKDKKTNPIVYRVLFFVFLGIFLVSTALLTSDWWKEWQAQKEFEDMENMTGNDDETEPAGSEGTKPTEDVSESESETEPIVNELEVLGITIPDKNLDWEAIQGKYKHVVAWIYIPGTKVDYPIMYHPEKPRYYLDHNLNGSKGLPGCIYMESDVNSPKFVDNNTILYGHNMKNKTMFGSLHNYENAQFFDEYRYVYVYTPETTLVYDIFASYVHSDSHIYYDYATYDKDGYQDYLDYIFDIRSLKANIREDAVVTTDTPILTLSTCNGLAYNDKRYIVNAVLINKSALRVYESAQEVAELPD